MSVGARPVDADGKAPETELEPMSESVEPAEDSASAAAPEPQMFSTPKPRQSFQSSDPIYVHIPLNAETGHKTAAAYAFDK